MFVCLVYKSQKSMNTLKSTQKIIHFEEGSSQHTVQPYLF